MMKNIIFLLCLICLNTIVYAQTSDSTEQIVTDPISSPNVEVTPINANQTRVAPANDDCSSATVLAIGNLICGQTTEDATLEGGECYTNYGGGVTEHSTWYRFTAATTSMVFAFNRTNTTNCVSPHIKIYGPYTPGAGCLPACSAIIYNVLYNADPGQHTLLNGLFIGSDYMIQIVDSDCGGPNDGHVEYCLGMFLEPSNNVAGSASTIDECGVVFDGTNVGYTPEDLVLGSDNLDGNTGTTCAGCTAGDDVPYVVNNSSWFSFCATDNGSWNVDFSDIANCVNTGPNFGLQMTIFRGTSTNLTVIEHAPSPSNPGSSWTSADFAVTAGECIYMVVDGFAGDQCDYSYTLNNVTGGCTLLPIEFNKISGSIKNGINYINWSTLSELNNSHYIIQRSEDGNNYIDLDQISGAGNSSTELFYEYIDRNVLEYIYYYRIKQIDFDGNESYSPTLVINNKNKTSKTIVAKFDLLGRPVNNSFSGFVIIVYDDGTKEKLFQTQD